MDCLLLRFDAPLISFGAVVVDQLNPTWQFPGTSMLAGLLGNALGWDHRDAYRLQSLQDRLRWAARWDAEPEPLTEYQTVDLGQSFLVETGWTTHGLREDRKGGAAATATHQRWRDHWANGVMTVSIGLDGEGDVALSMLEAAMLAPARPLFIGRKPCLPAGRILLGRRQASGVKAALAAEPRADIGPRRCPARLRSTWPLDEDAGAHTEERYDLRNWTNNIHRGSRRHAVGFLELSI